MHFHSLLNCRDKDAKKNEGNAFPFYELQIPGTGGLFLLVIKAFRHLIDALKYGILNYIHKNFAFQQQLGPGVLYL